MGRGCQAWATHSGALGVGGVGDGHWLMLTGGPSPDVNMVLVHDGDPQTLAAVERTVADRGYATLMMLAGRSREAELQSGWQHAGAMPFMSAELDGASLRFDPRVRRAGRQDFDTVAELIAEAFGLGREDADVCARVLLTEDESMNIWLLIEDGQPVSTVTTVPIDDAVCVWCMATPSRFERRGYGRALLGDVLLRAAEAGASIGLLGATPAGQPLYEAMGWETLEGWQIYLNAQSAQFAH